MKVLRLALYLLAGGLLLALALFGLFGVWSGASSSLSTSLNQLARYLPAGQTLEFRAVEGSLRDGGSIGWLRWRQGDLSVEAFDVRVAWALRDLPGGALRLSELTVRQLRIVDARAASTPTPPADLHLPIRLDLPFSVATVEWVGMTSLQLSELQGRYSFDGEQHRLHVAQVAMAAGTYQLQGSLQAQPPMALKLQIDGRVQAPVPARSQRLTLQARAALSGQLAGPQATLALQAQLRPEFMRAAGPAMQADITARLQPWQAQPVSEASARWQALDLALLWPQAPQTRLDGSATVSPRAGGWRAAIVSDNAREGPWNQQRLPLRQVKAGLVFMGERWMIESLHATGAGGRIEAQGQLARAAGQALDQARWQGHARIQGINPAAVDSRLAATSLDGQLSASQTAAGLSFEASLQPAKGRPAALAAASALTRALDGLRLQSVEARGLWQAPLLKLDSFTLRTDEAQLQGRLSLHTRSLATEGRLDLTLPGAVAAAAGQMASSSGQGSIDLNLSDAALATRWLRRWPGVSAALGGLPARGGAGLTGSWQGGWGQQGENLQLQAELSVGRLDLGADTAGAAQWRLREARAALAGTLRAFQLTLGGQLENASRRFALQAQAQAGWLGAGRWQAGVDTAQLSVQDSLRPGLWTLQLSERLRLEGQQDAAGQRWRLAAGSARLRGPVPGLATLNWQPAQWSRQLSGPARPQWQTQGRLQGLPLAWLELLGQTRIANLGLRGDLLFDGRWEATGGDVPRLRATLERSSGDLQLQGAEADAPVLSAGTRLARLAIGVEGDELTAQLRWDSERAGTVQADLSTRLQWQDGGWRWLPEAPLRGSLNAQLPPIGAWSLLAPPGWRLRGTLDAQATLAGTRGSPQWHGTLQAQDVAVRSVVDGIDFSQGTLKTRLDGERLEIQELSLRGAAGAGLLTVTGAVDWLPATPSAATVLSRLRMRLEGRAQGLRVSARADRRLVVSGQLSAQLAAARLEVRGALRADQALFIVPEDTVPQLGEDVRVRASGPARDAAALAPAPAPPAPAGARLSTHVTVSLDPGPDFQVRGRGLVTRLAGSLELRSAAERGLQPRLTGELRTVGGSYRAYGQQLDIEEGLLRFFGPYDNPALDILAIRPNLQQRVGVQISGSALSPVLRLYAEPDLPEAEKLAWLVLGRAAASGGAEAALLQQAALALLGRQGQGLSGGLAQSLGLDELSVRGLASTTGNGATAATVTLGKRVSRHFYVAYERSLAGTLGTFFIFYDLSRRFTLRAQTGEQSAVDLIFTLRYD